MLRLIKHDRRLVPVRCATVNLGRWLPVGEQQVVCNPRNQAALAVLAGYLDISHAVLPRSIGPLPPKQRPDNLIALPRLQRKRLSRPFTLAVA
jgi:hypothetical protein